MKWGVELVRKNDLKDSYYRSIIVGWKTHKIFKPIEKY
jgi:hypothetical protein